MADDDDSDGDGTNKTICNQDVVTPSREKSQADDCKKSFLEPKIFRKPQQHKSFI